MVTFKVSPNFEAPTDAGTNNVYDIVVRANDGTLDTTKAVAITVTNVNDDAGDQPDGQRRRSQHGGGELGQRHGGGLTALATDSDAGGQHQYAHLPALDGQRRRRFTINGVNRRGDGGQRCLLDFETRDHGHSITMLAHASDDGSTTSAAVRHRGDQRHDRTDGDIDHRHELGNREYRDSNIHRDVFGDYDPGP